MRVLLFFYCLFCVTNCSAQQKQNLILPTIDTLDISDISNVHICNEIAQSKNAMIIEKTTYEIEIGDSQYTITTKEKLSNLLHQNISTIQQKKFYVIIDTVNTKDLVDIIQIIQSLKIDNYTIYAIVVKRFKPAEAVPITIPTATTTMEHLLRDSSYLKITLQNGNYKICLLNDSLITNDTGQIDEFISIRKDKIIEGKIILIGAGQEPYPVMDEILGILKKHNYFRFQLLTDPNSN